MKYFLWNFRNTEKPTEVEVGAYCIDYLAKDLPQDALDEGVMVELPTMDCPEGKSATLMLNTETKIPFYRYDDIPAVTPSAEQQRIEALEMAVAELSMMITQSV